MPPQPLITSHPLWRLLEIIPGALSWTALIAPIIISLYRPDWVAIFIIIYSTFWLFRSVLMSFNLYRAFRHIRANLKINWLNKLKTLDDPDKLDTKIQKTLLSLETKQQSKNWRDIYHAVILLTYKEDLDLLRQSIASYANSNFPKDKIVLILAGEASDEANFLNIADILAKEFKNQFYKFIITLHPQNIPGEIRGKSANATFAAKNLKNFLDEKNIAYDNVLVSNFDADTVAHPDYFAELTYKYILAENRTHLSYQPIHFYHNNIWDVPLAIRLIALAGSFWRMAESMNQKRYKSFSSRSNSFKTIVEVNYWDPSVIPEDSRQYWTAYFTYNGQHKLVPLYCPLYMDAVLSSTFIKTFKNQYLQLRRWSWGVCDFPFVVLNFWKSKTIPLGKKIYHIFFLLEGHFFWATAPLLLSITGWLPQLLNKSFSTTTLSYYLPQWHSNLMSLASVLAITSIILSFIILPEPPSKRSFLAKSSLIFQWLFVPIVSIFLSALPALESQTRLMFGKRLEYQVTEKTRKK